MPFSACCHIELSPVTEHDFTLIFVKVVGRGVNETRTYEFREFAVIEESEVATCLERCVFLFQGMIEYCQTRHIFLQRTSPAMAFFISCISAERTGIPFHLM